MNLLRIKETCIYVTDLLKTREFYHERLKLPIISLLDSRHIFFRAGSSVLLCFLAEKTKIETELPPHGAAGSIHFAFEVPRDEYDVTLQHIIAADIIILHQHVWKDGLRSFYFHDPDNNLLEVIEEGLWES